MAERALFEGLVFDEADNPAGVAQVGGQAHYVVDDAGFLRHIDAESVDRQVLAVMVAQLEDNQELATEQAMNFLGSDDLFTKAAIDASLRNISIDHIIAQGLPAQARDMMGLLGFKVVVNVHGEVVRFDQPAGPAEEL
ncbi:MAG: hypothetical protein ACRDHL_13850 [Candidatus Promineifilaceae bacterium]